jgi:hypothetical protein
MPKDQNCIDRVEGAANRRVLSRAAQRPLDERQDR